jgi:hypothetical protein
MKLAKAIEERGAVVLSPLLQFFALKRVSPGVKAVNELLVYVQPACGANAPYRIHI